MSSAWGHGCNGGEKVKAVNLAKVWVCMHAVGVHISLLKSKQAHTQCYRPTPRSQSTETVGGGRAKWVYNFFLHRHAAPLIARMKRVHLPPTSKGCVVLPQSRIHQMKHRHTQFNWTKMTRLGKHRLGRKTERQKAQNTRNISAHRQN